MNFRNLVHFVPVPNFQSFWHRCRPNLSKYLALAVYDIIQHRFRYAVKNVRMVIHHLSSPRM